MKAILSEKGQVTIPKPCRERLGLLPGTVLDFDASQGRLIAIKVQSEDVVRKWRGRGRLPGGMRVNQYLARIRA